MKELLFDNVGFQSREEKVKLGIASEDLMPFIIFTDCGMEGGNPA